MSTFNVLILIDFLHCYIKGKNGAKATIRQCIFSQSFVIFLSISPREQSKSCTMGNEKELDRKPTSYFLCNVHVSSRKSSFLCSLAVRLHIRYARCEQAPRSFRDLRGLHSKCNFLNNHSVQNNFCIQYKVNALLLFFPYLTYSQYHPHNMQFNALPLPSHGCMHFFLFFHFCLFIVSLK